MSRFIVAGAMVPLLLGEPAAAEIYYSRSAQENRVIVIDPFSPTATRTLAGLQQISYNNPGSSAILSIDTRISKISVDHPQDGRLFTVTRDINFDMSLVVDRINAGVERYRKNGCSKTKISYPQIVGMKPHKMLVRMDINYKKRTCGWHGTHDIAKAEGYIVLGVGLADVDNHPQIRVTQEDYDLDISSIFGVSAGSLFGQIIKFATFDLATLFGTLNHVKGSIGEVQFKLAHPVVDQAKAEAALSAQQQYSSGELTNITRGYGSVARMLDNPSAKSLKFSLAESRMHYRPDYAVRPQYAGRVSPTLCSELRAEGLAELYCNRTGATTAVLSIRQRFDYAEDARPLIEGYFLKEGVYLSSLGKGDEWRFYSDPARAEEIALREYQTVKFAPFVRKNNPSPECMSDSVSGPDICRVKIVPAWRSLPRFSAIGS